MTDFDLKLCPFCGGYAATTNKKVFCVYCGAEISTTVHTTEDVVALWNERVHEAKPDMAEVLELIRDELGAWYLRLDNGESLGDVSPQLADMMNWADAVLASGKGEDDDRC